VAGMARILGLGSFGYVASQHGCNISIPMLKRKGFYCGAAKL